MPSVQSTYTSTMRVALPGMLANEIPATLISRTVETAAGIGLGVAAEQGTGDLGCIVFDGGTVLGITVRERSTDPATPDKFAQYESARIMVKGAIWVTCTTGCSAGDPVYVRPSNNTFQDSSANSGVQIAGARWETSAEAGAVALIRMG